MKLRLIPILISFFVSVAVLFGGWFLYDSYAMQNPLSDIVLKIDGVREADVDIQKDTAAVKLKLDPGASLREIHQAVTKQGASIVGERKIKLEVEGTTSSKLEKIWSQSLFEIAESMESKQYAQIPKILERLAAGNPGLKVNSEIDDTNIYIELSDEEASKFVILPRNPARIGVWPNE